MTVLGTHKLLPFFLQQTIIAHFFLFPGAEGRHSDTLCSRAEGGRRKKTQNLFNFIPLLAETKIIHTKNCTHTLHISSAWLPVQRGAALRHTLFPARRGGGTHKKCQNKSNKQPAVFWALPKLVCLIYFAIFCVLRPPSAPENK